MRKQVQIYILHLPDSTSNENLSLSDRNRTNGVLLDLSRSTTETPLNRFHFQK